GHEAPVQIRQLVRPYPDAVASHGGEEHRVGHQHEADGQERVEEPDAEREDGQGGPAQGGDENPEDEEGWFLGGDEPLVECHAGRKPSREGAPPGEVAQCRRGGPGRRCPLSSSCISCSSDRCRTSCISSAPRASATWSWSTRRGTWMRSRRPA